MSVERRDELPPVPQSRDIEIALLGAFLVGTDGAEKTFEELDGEDFFDVRNRIIFETLRAMHRESKPTNDLWLLVVALEKSGKIESVGGPGYVSKIGDGCAQKNPNLGHYRLELRQLSARRRAMSIGELASGPYAESALAEVAGLAQRIAGDPAPSKNGEAVDVSLVCVLASEVEPQNIAWLWPNRIPATKLTVFCGPPDVGKSATAIDIIARGTTGRPWPDCENNLPPFDILMLVDEDGLGDTVVPRLMAAGADRNRVHFATQTKMTGKTKTIERHIALDTDLQAIEKLLVQNPNIKLVVIDPLASYLGKLKKNAEEEIRGLLVQAKELAERCGVAVLTIDHFNKNYNQAGIHRLSGAGALAAVPRAVWAFIKDPDDSENRNRLMLNLKLNIVEESKKAGLKYRFAKVPVTINDKTNDLPVMDWRGGTAGNIDEILQSQADPAERRSAKAAKFLTTFLAGGARASEEIFVEAAKVHISRSAMFQAKKTLPIRSYRAGSAWWWEIEPDPNASTVVN